MKCNHCGGIMRKFQSASLSCVFCGRENKKLSCPFCKSQVRIKQRNTLIRKDWREGYGEKEVDIFDIVCPKPDCFLHKGTSNKFETEALAWETWENRHEPV